MLYLIKRRWFKTALVLSALIFTGCFVLSSCNNGSIDNSSNTSNNSTTEVSELITEKKIAITEDNVKFLGRVAKSNERWYLDWTNAGIEFTFTGTDAFLKMGPPKAAASNNPCFLVYVDDNEPVKIDELKEFKKIAVAKELPFGEHTVRVIKVSESTGVPVAMGEIRTAAACTSGGFRQKDAFLRRFDNGRLRKPR